MTPWQRRDYLKAGGVALVVLLLLVLVVKLWADVRREREAKLVAQNALAVSDTTRVLQQDQNRVITERLAEQRDGQVRLEGKLGRIAEENRETGAALFRLRVAFDSVLATTSGTVTADAGDSTVRRLDAELDTAGVAVGISAAVPPPPRLATVDWRVRFDTLSILTTLSRTPTGQAVWRAETEGWAKVIADSLVLEREKEAPRFLGIRLPDVWGAVLFAVPAALTGYAVGKVF